MAIDVNRGTSGLVTLPREVSQEIWQNVAQQSVVQTLAPRTDLPAGGIQIPVITEDPEAAWVNETDEKPVSRPAFDNKFIQGYKMAVIVPFSNEFRRDMNSLYNAVVAKLPAALSKKFDRTALGFEKSPGDYFDTLKDAPEVALDGFDAYRKSLGVVSDADGDISAWALGPRGENDALGFVDNSGRPLLLTDVQEQGSVGQILARPVFKSKNAQNDKVVGIAGDWASTLWGAVEDITLRISDQATINDNGTPINLWQRNMFAVLAEFEVGFAVRDPKRFVRLTTATETQ